MFDSIKDDFFTFLRFQSIATDPDYLDEVKNCADWLQGQLEEAGLKCEKWETTGAPTLLATNLDAGSDKETLLIYCHYDVQPVDPLNLWESPPFEPTVRNKRVYARGASDDKGQCFYTLIALKHHFQKHGNFPINIKFLIEGEEESGSESLNELLEEKKEELSADHLLIVDVGFPDPKKPVITLGTRGIIALELTIEEASVDLHSGSTGGIAYNPNRALVEILSKCHDSTGTVAIPGFYDELTEPTPGELEELDMDYDLESFEETFGFIPNGMEEGVSAPEANWLRPTLEINGICGGYTGTGFKTVIPSKATAKISCRLVPQQTPERIISLVSEFIHSQAPDQVKVTLNSLTGSGAGFRCRGDSRIATIMSQSYTEVFQTPCKKILCGGSIPIAPALALASGAQTILVGTALMGDQVHAPNESFSIESFEKGYQTILRMLELFT
ncbi:MAG: Succinyl-diaminopimelate desuccinylase [Chlamydiales bacterium]|nr:Succinyl-diaminopimelate desuccinylase [Chlamydiales bacterium]MCH9620557.1 Succinyl-diaminopimelate desuccinylase [Chlamydiales bacterium]MCH9622995.1 Succinyl-diaminopimelate desuccinylase [Chlamydiales bacterium]